MKGVRWETVTSHADARGELRPLEFGNPLDFLPARIFVISHCPPEAVRASHAVSSQLALVALIGSVRVTLDNGEARETFTLSSPDRTLLLQPGIWLQLSAFSADCQLMVIASETFGAVRYYDQAEPGLMTGL